MRRASRIDDTQREIVSALREIGVSVALLHSVGQGCPDLLLGYRGKTLLMECKGEASLKRFPKTNGRNPGQVEWHRMWNGAPVLTVASVAEAVDAVV